MKKKLKNKDHLRLIIKEDKTCVQQNADAITSYPDDIEVKDFKTQIKLDAEIKKLGLTPTDDE